MELEELFESYLNGKMSEEDASLFEKLLKENLEYQIQFDQFREKFTGNSVSEAQPIQPSSKISTIKTWSITAGIAVAIVVVGFFLIRSLSMPPGEKLFLSYYEPKQVPDSVTNLDNQLIVEAISTYQSKDYAKAESLFENLKNEDESDLSLFYVGLCQLELDRPEKAIPTLSLVSQKSDYFFEATWYGAMSFLKLNKLEEAKRLLLISDANPNFYSEKAEEILEKMN